MAAGPYYSSLLFNKVNPFADATENHLRNLQNHAMLMLMGFFWCLMWNVAAVAILWMAGGVETKALLLAIAYLVCLFPAAMWLWYGPLCQALRTQNASNIRRFLQLYLLHTAFCIFAAISPPVICDGRSLTGILSAMDAYGEAKAPGFSYFIGFGLFTLEALVSVRFLNEVSMYYRSGGLALEMV